MIGPDANPTPAPNSAREEILNRLRTTLARPDLRFPPRKPEPLTPETRMTVTEAIGNAYDLAQRFGVELENLHGSYEVVETPSETRLALINRLLTWMEQDETQRKGAVVASGQESSVLTWEPTLLPVEGIGPALADLDLTLVTPRDLRSGESRDRVRFIRYGITGVEAAFASTGSMLVHSSGGHNRAASLLPLRHIALIPFSRLYATPESWLAARRMGDDLVSFVRRHANLTMITGPSKSADIEMNLTLGVHGPKYVHAILFEDTP